MEEISQDEWEKIREEERRKIMKEMKREKHAIWNHEAKHLHVGLTIEYDNSTNLRKREKVEIEKKNGLTYLCLIHQVEPVVTCLACEPRY